MSKDIRSYFLTTSKKTVETNNPEVKTSKKRKKHNIVLSDSDEEPDIKSPIKNKVKKGVDKKESNNEKAKYFEVNKETVHKLFGNSPVRNKRVPSSKATDLQAKKNGEFDDLLEGIDDDDDDWESSYVNNSDCKAQNSSQNEEYDPQQDVILKKRKLDNGSEICSTIKETVIKSNSEVMVKKTPKKVRSRLSTPSPQKKTDQSNSPSPQKKKSQSSSPSPQKIMSFYFSPKKNGLEKLQTEIPNKQIRTDKLMKNFQERMISPKKKSESFVGTHDLSPDNSDDDVKNSNKSREKTLSEVGNKSMKPNLVNKIAEHTISSDSSDEEENTVNIAKKESPKTETKIPSTNRTKVTNKLQPVIVEKISNTPKFELWVDKYKPTNLKSIIGQQGDKSNVNKLLKWLKSWFENQSGNKKLMRPSPWAKNDDGAYFKAALLSGPPGIGKTTTAHLVSKELNMDVVEFNASDTRSKKLLNQEITELLSSKSLSPYMQGGGVTSRKHVLLMDEVDGMAGNEDRGGIQELISLIKNSKIPIICMCNDRNHPKIRSLVNYCFDLRFSIPRVDQVKGAMLSICYKENLKIKPDLLAQIIENANRDIRLVLNHLSVLSARKEQTMNLSNKEVKMGAWDVARKVFSNTEHKNMSIHDKCDLFFHDYSIAPLFVQENYLNVIPYSEKGKTKQGKMELFAKTADSLCCGDLVDNAIRSQSAWSLLPTQAVFSSLIPGDILSGRVGAMINFPSWLGKNSRKNKLDRLCQEIQLHTRLRASASKEAICTDYSYKLKYGIASPLVAFGSEGVENSLEFLHEYNLLREDIESLSELTTWPDTKDPFASLEPKVKAAFTRAYNKRPVLTPFSTSGVLGVKKGRKGNNDENNGVDLVGSEEMSEEVVGSNESDEENEDILADGMIVVKKKDKENIKKENSLKEPSTSKKPRGGKKGRK